MSVLNNKRILLGVTGGIAAYKSAELVRLFKKAGADVRVVMTAAAQSFVGALTFQALSGQPVHIDLLDPEAEAGMGHIELARWADLIVIAPATAETLAKLSTGRADDLLTTVCLARKSSLAVAPAMNQAMWSNSATQKNIADLNAGSILVWGPGTGEQACGDTGEGRMLEPTELLARCEAHFSTQALAGKTVVITAGPTREALDPVRYLSNHSSGKMGYALAEAAAEAGANTILISGPVSLAVPDRVNLVSVVSAQQMLQAALENIEKTDIFIAAAAVADYRPLAVVEQKMKKSADHMQLELVKNPDILSAVANSAHRPSWVVGFAAETEFMEQHARLKLSTKNVDMVVANNVAEGDGVFNSDSNQVVLISASASQAFERQSKQQLARTLIHIFSEQL